jgi:hypothetical protein
MKLIFARGADISSDHHKLVAKTMLKLLAQKTCETKRRKFNTGKLQDPNVGKKF